MSCKEVLGLSSELHVLSTHICYLCCNILVEEVDKVEETPLVVSLELSTCSVDSLEAILILVRSKLVVVNKTPCQCSDDIYSVQMH